MRPSEVIADLREQLAAADGVIHLLKGALAAQGVDGGPVWGAGLSALTPQELQFVGALWRAKHRPVSRERVLELVSSRGDPEDRSLKLAGVLACGVRKKLGFSAIENLRGQGYRLGADLRQQMKDQAA